MKRFKKGAASFYIVSFSTLILVIIAASFATVVLSEVTRSSNDDLSQSAYDSALAGVEDAKIAYANYQRCLTNTSLPNCGLIISEMDSVVLHPEENHCDMVGRMTGRLGSGDTGEVLIKDETTSLGGSSTISELNQAYTCVEIKTELEDYRANLTASNNTRLVNVKFSDSNAARNIDEVVLSWYSVRDEKNGRADYNFSNFDSNKVVFRPVDEVRPSSPPTIELRMVQTPSSFKISDLNGPTDSYGNTDRATMFFVPINDKNKAGNRNSDANYVGAYASSNDENIIEANEVASTNNRTHVNLPFGVYCDKDSTSGFLCTVRIKLPKPIGGDRAEGTFMFLVTLPYHEPDTDFALSFYSSRVVQTQKGVQISIDSTGRANDLFRRVETRLETRDVSFSYEDVFAVQLFGTDNMVIDKNLKVTSEHNRTEYRTN